METVILLGNCPSHLSAKKLGSEYGNIFAMFLPPNTTAIVQSIDQNVIQHIKFNYRKHLLSNIFAGNKKGVD